MKWNLLCHLKDHGIWNLALAGKAEVLYVKESYITWTLTKKPVI